MSTTFYRGQRIRAKRTRELYWITAVFHAKRGATLTVQKRCPKLAYEWIGDASERVFRAEEVEIV